MYALAVHKLKSKCFIQKVLESVPKLQKTLHSIIEEQVR